MTPTDASRGLSGVYVEEVRPDSPAARVKISPGDLIVVADRWIVSDLITFARVLSRERVGATIDIEVHRQSRQLRGSVTLE
jgi:S1-C subfamily serine protease